MADATASHGMVQHPVLTALKDPLAATPVAVTGVAAGIDKAAHWGWLDQLVQAAPLVTMGYTILAMIWLTFQMISAIRRKD